MSEQSTSRPDRRRLIVVGAVAAVLLLTLAALLGYGARRIDAADPAATRTVAPGSPTGRVTPASGLGTVAVADLPRQAGETLALIDSGGPFPYSRDGIVFGNNERLLPEQPRGYYREYTVPTPGERDRGARRLVVGGAGDVYYTDDHYDSFRQVLR